MPVRYWIAFFVLTITISCQDKPKDILSNDEMALLLADLHFTDGVLQVNMIAKNNKKELPEDYYNFILKKHNCSLEKYRKSLDYYTKKPEKLDALYDQVFKNLEKLEYTFKPKAEKQIQVPDSILNNFNDERIQYTGKRAYLP